MLTIIVVQASQLQQNTKPWWRNRKQMNVSENQENKTDTRISLRTKQNNISSGDRCLLIPLVVPPSGTFSITNIAIRRKKKKLSNSNVTTSHLSWGRPLFDAKSSREREKAKGQSYHKPVDGSNKNPSSKLLGFVNLRPAHERRWQRLQLYKTLLAK